MGLRNPSDSFPGWTETVGTMLDSGMGVRLLCDGRCSRYRSPNLLAIIEAKGRDFTLQNRRFICRWKPRCPGWIRVYYESGVFRPLVNNATTTLWIEQDRLEYDEREKVRLAGLFKIRKWRDRLDDAEIVDPETGLSARDLDAILGNRLPRIRDGGFVTDGTKRPSIEAPYPLEPPLGVDARAWNNAADDRARKRLIRDARG